MWKQFLLVMTQNLKTVWVGLWHVKIVQLILCKAEHYVGPNPDISRSIFWAVTPLTLNHFHI